MGYGFQPHFNVSEVSKEEYEECPANNAILHKTNKGQEERQAFMPLFDKAGITVKKKPDLKAKLDKEFSFLSGFVIVCQTEYFRCISCGQIKPFTYKQTAGTISVVHIWQHGLMRTIAMPNAGTV